MSADQTAKRSPEGLPEGVPYLNTCLCDCGKEFEAPYWSDREKCDTCLFPSPPESLR